MRSLSAAELLNIWEQGLSQSLIQRVLSLLATTYPEIPSEQLVNLSIGQRDGLLLSVREQLFGSQLASLAECPGCHERVELNFYVADIRLPFTLSPSKTLELSLDEYDICVRLPTSLDLIELLHETHTPSPETIATVRNRLLERCLLSVQHRGELEALAQLPTSILEVIVDQMAAADPQADIQLNLVCPACQHTWQVAFDIVSFLWNEINAWAYRLLREVHTLALAYGWAEADILAMSSRRRHLYLEMLNR